MKSLHNFHCVHYGKSLFIRLEGLHIDDSNEIMEQMKAMILGLA